MDGAAGEIPDHPAIDSAEAQLPCRGTARAIGHTIDIEPCDQMIVQPTDGALTDFNSKKLQIAIDHSPSLARKVAPQTARSGKASTTSRPG